MKQNEEAEREDSPIGTMDLAGTELGTTGARESWFPLEHRQVFSRSKLWDIQRRYYAERGVDAWRQGEVPHYITTNPTIANDYAEIVFAFWRDHCRLHPGDQASVEPQYICELGGGPGRFAFHFLSCLTRLCQQEGVTVDAFRYVLTDFTESNLQFWRQHPNFAPFLESGLLDLAVFDINNPYDLKLQVSGATLAPGSLASPPAVIANYVLDSVPQELYYIDDGQCYQTLITLWTEEDPSALSNAELLLSRLHYRYDYEIETQPPSTEPDLQRLLADYQRKLTDTHLLFPAVALRSLRWLASLSGEGLLLLTADKGDDRYSAVEGAQAPGLVHHGSFSLPVNYHALKKHCEHSGGLALFPTRHHRGISVGCLLIVPRAAEYTETQHAYQRYVQDFGPDDFYIITHHARDHSATMFLDTILAYLLLSRYDSSLLATFMPRLLELAPTLNQAERQDLTIALERVWKMYFPLGEDPDLPYGIACVLSELGDYPRAMRYYEQSMGIYGEHSAALYNMAVCCHRLNYLEEMRQLLRRALALDPTNPDIIELLAGFKE